MAQYNSWRPLFEHEGATWHSHGRIVWVDTYRAAQEVRDLLEQEGYFYFDGDLVDGYFYSFVFRRKEPLDYTERLKPGEIVLCYRLLRSQHISTEVVYRFDETKLWAVFSAPTNGLNEAHLELCRASRNGAMVKTRPCLDPTYSRSS